MTEDQKDGFLEWVCDRLAAMPKEQQESAERDIYRFLDEREAIRKD